MRGPHLVIKTWLKSATPQQARDLAKIADTSVAHMRHIAAGRRDMSADLAQRLAHASKDLRIKALYLDQRHLCAACARCTLAN